MWENAGVKSRDESSAGGIVYRERDGGVDVVLIRTHEGRWQLPKGWIEAGETAEAAALREVREEGGVDAQLIGPLDEIRYQFVSTYDPEPARVNKTVRFFLLRYVAGSPEDHDDEVADAAWVEIGEAQRLLTFKEERRIMSLARDALAPAAIEP